MGNIFLKLSDPKLRQVSKNISEKEINSKSTQDIINKMLKIGFGEQKDSKKPVMVGLAAPQIGISKRIILVDIKADGKGKVGDLRVYINPEIIWISKRKGEWYEGCYSANKVCGIVKRSIGIKIKALSLKISTKSRGVATIPPPRWKQVEEKWEGYIARIFQHEIDHLNGILFMDHIKNPNHLHFVKPEEFPLYRNKQAWKNWPKKYPLPLASGKLKKV